jgi:hypothetical protein
MSTSASVASGIAGTSYVGKSNYDYFLKPLFIGNNPLTQAGIRVIPNVKSDMWLNYFGTLSKILKAYQKGFNTGTLVGTGATYTQRKLSVVRMKAEVAEDYQEFYQTIFEEAGKSGIDWNDITGTEIETIVRTLFLNAVAADIFRQVWLSDVYKETATSGSAFTGTADTNYNAFEGFWHMLMGAAATSPSATQIKLVDLNVVTTYLATAAVADVQTLTWTTAASGTAAVIVNGVTYTATYDTSATQTSSNFVTANAAALLLRGITCALASATVTFTAAIPGMPVTTITAANVTGTLAGTVVHTTSNVVAGALVTDGAIAAFKAMFAAMPAVMRQFYSKSKGAELKWLVSSDVYDNYRSTIETGAHDGAWLVKQDGVEKLMYRGIEVVDMMWDSIITEDFPLSYRPHRIILTVNGNLVVGTDVADDYNRTDFWYNKDAQENRARIQLKLGTQYVHPNLMVLGYA